MFIDASEFCNYETYLVAYEIVNNDYLKEKVLSYRDKFKDNGVKNIYSNFIYDANLDNKCNDEGVYFISDKLDYNALDIVVYYLI